MTPAPWDAPTIQAWADAVAPWLYGPLALRPDEAGRLTPFEIEWLARGYQWRHERQWDQLAVILLHLGHTRSNDPWDLLGRQLGDSDVPGFRSALRWTREERVDDAS